MATYLITGVAGFIGSALARALLDRGAGMFRLGPFGINVPAGHIYEPGTNTLLTSWKAPNGWATVREALTIGPRQGEGTRPANMSRSFEFDISRSIQAIAFLLRGRQDTA